MSVCYGVRVVLMATGVCACCCAASTTNVQELLADMKLQKDFTLLLMGCRPKKRDAPAAPLPLPLPIGPGGWVAVGRKRGSGTPTPYEGANSPLARSSRDRRGDDDDERKDTGEGAAS